MARAIKQGQHIFIAFQDGEAVLDSQLRPRMYKSREQFEKSFPAWRDGKAELVEYAPTLTPPNEWVSVNKRLPEKRKDVLVHYGNGRIGIDWIDSTQCFVFDELYGRVTHWLPIPELPDRRPKREQFEKSFPAWRDGKAELVEYAPTLPQPSNEALALEYREYRCAECGHEWMEDCDATDYPNYCPGCGNELRRPPEEEA